VESSRDPTTITCAGKDEIEIEEKELCLSVSEHRMGRFSPVHVPLSFVAGLTAFHVSCILLFGWLLSALFGNPEVVPWHLAFTSLYVCEVLSLFTHWIGHRRIEVFPFSLWYEAHTTGHHVNDYPGERFPPRSLAQSHRAQPTSF
jgi:hypothetical protein